MTRREWLGQRFYSSLYWFQVVYVAWELNLPSYAGVSDFYLRGCWEHDIHYRTGKDIYGNSLTRAEADRYFRWYIWCYTKTFLTRDVRSWWHLGGLAAAWLSWVGVRLFGGNAWKGA